MMASCGQLSLAGPRRAPQALLVVTSFYPDRMIRRRPIGVMCADSLVSRHVPPVCFAAAPDRRLAPVNGGL